MANILEFIIITVILAAAAIAGISYIGNLIYFGYCDYKRAHQN